MIQIHLHVALNSFLLTCEGVIRHFEGNCVNNDPMTKLVELCVLSASPFLRPLRAIRSLINALHTTVVGLERSFSRNFIFSSFAIAV
jgi:hypothetical protein